MTTRKREMQYHIPPTTLLKLFRYPHKNGGVSWCVGFERHNHSDRGHFVSQTFLTEWSDEYEYHLKALNSWKQSLGVE